MPAVRSAFRFKVLRNQVHALICERSGRKKIRVNNKAATTTTTAAAAEATDQRAPVCVVHAYLVALPLRSQLLDKEEDELLHRDRANCLQEQLIKCSFS